MFHNPYLQHERSTTGNLASNIKEGRSFRLNSFPRLHIHKIPDSSLHFSYVITETVPKMKASNPKSRRNPLQVCELPKFTHNAFLCPGAVCDEEQSSDLCVAFERAGVAPCLQSQPRLGTWLQSALYVDETANLPNFRPMPG